MPENLSPHDCRPHVAIWSTSAKIEKCFFRLPLLIHVDTVRLDRVRGNDEITATGCTSGQSHNLYRGGKELRHGSSLQIEPARYDEHELLQEMKRRALRPPTFRSTANVPSIQSRTLPIVVRLRRRLGRHAEKRRLVVVELRLARSGLGGGSDGRDLQVALDRRSRFA